jgi:5-methyltetrahydrofolate--homocysteine methyltransferase
MSQERDKTAHEPVLVAKANCGIPKYVEGKIVYNGTPELMAEYARLAYAAGATIIGGCCGTTPEHVRAMRLALEEGGDLSRPDVETVVQRLGTVSEGLKAQITGAPMLQQSSARRSRRRISKGQGV